MPQELLLLLLLLPCYITDSAHLDRELGQHLLLQQLLLLAAAAAGARPTMAHQVQHTR
jgi:hypothetical protein